jgi:hypothetical protein
MADTSPLATLNACDTDQQCIVTLPIGKSARITATRGRDEVTYFWIRYDRSESGWLQDGPPFDSIDPYYGVPGGHGTMEYVARTQNVLTPVTPQAHLKVQVIARGNWVGVRDRCLRVDVIKAADRTTLQFYTGDQEPWNLEINIIYV